MELELVDPDGSPAAAAATMDRACREHGFFGIPLDCVGRAVADAAWNDAQAFFSLPESTKREVQFPEPGYPYGYSPFQYESLGRSREDPSGSEPALVRHAPDLKESLSVGPDCGIHHADVFGPEQSWIRSPSQWPQDPAGLQASWTTYYRALTEVTGRLMGVMARALDLPTDHFVPLIDRPISALRAIHYPEASAKTPGQRAGAHTDYGTLTILRTDDVPGLEIQAVDGSWTPVDPNPDTLVVNLGDSIAQWTNDRWRSTMHRVTCVDPRPRSSFAFFHTANWDAEIRCLPTCQSPHNPPRHSPVTAGPWLMQKFQATVT